MARLESDFPGQQGQDMAVVAAVGNTPEEAEENLRNNRAGEVGMVDTYLPVAQVVVDPGRGNGADMAY